MPHKHAVRPRSEGIMKDTEFIWQRTTETFPDWVVALPILFAFVLLFVIGSFRRGTGVKDIAWAMATCFVIPACLALQTKTTTGVFLHDVLLPFVRDLVGGTCLAGITMHLVHEVFGVPRSKIIAVTLMMVSIAFWMIWAPYEQPLHEKLVLPLVLFAIQLIVGLWRARMAWPIVIVLLLGAGYVPLALLFKPAFSWWVVLAPMLLVAMFYVALMYVKDAQSIHPAWAAFLGLLRCTVYGILAFVFLLPGCQVFDQNEYFPKLLLLFDVSGSMKTKDDLLEPGQRPETLLTRQDKVLDFLTGNVSADKQPRTPFLTRLLEKSPATAYRFGSVADESLLMQLDSSSTPGRADWQVWLNPDRKDIVLSEKLKEEDKLKQRARLIDLYDSLTGGTNVGGSALQVLKAESASYLQAIVIVSDGQSNIGSSESVHEFLARVNNPKRKVPVITVGVGQYRQPASIRIDDLQAPQIARPDDRFPVRVPVVGTGLRDQEFDVVLELVRSKDNVGNPLKGEQKFRLPAKRGKFKGAGDYPQDVVEFEVDLQQLRGIKAGSEKSRDLEGEWEIVARVPRNTRESFAEPEHISDPPTRVLVQNKELRVLLFAGGPTRDYQFLRTLLFREVQEKRMELSVYLQTGKEEGVDQDVAGERLLSHFPNRLGQDDPSDKYSSLNMYDVLIAIDPDWNALEASQIKMLEQWVGRDAGGVIFIAGPVNSFQLARSREELQPLRSIFPVVLRDFRLTPLGLGVDTTRPYPLHFAPAATGVDFLKLDEKGEEPTAGWERFFWGDAGAPSSKDARPVRGIFNYYPVDSIRPDSTVLATFGGPEATRISDGKDEQPYLVTMRYGNGKTVYLSSGETWRLRQYREAFHERLWIKMARFAASGSTQQKKYGRILMGRKSPAGSVSFEAQIKGADLMPLPRDTKPMVFVRKRGAEEAKPESFELRPKTTQGDWHGWFTGSFKVRDAGEYEFTIPIPNTTESLSHQLEVYRPNIEEANVRENHKELYHLATEAAPLLNRLPGETRKEVEKLLQPVAEELKDSKGSKDAKEGARLFFTLSSADAIPKLLVKLDPRRERTKGGVVDVWDQGDSLSLFHLLWSVPLGLGLLTCAILLFHQRYVWAVVALVLAVIAPLMVAAADRFIEPTWLTTPIDFSFVLVVTVGLLSIEWLTRKLLKLA